MQDCTSHNSDEDCNFNMIQSLKPKKHENREISNDCFSMDPWIILDHPHTTRQGRKDMDDDKHCSGGDGAEQCKDKENSKIQF